MPKKKTRKQKCVEDHFIQEDCDNNKAKRSKRVCSFCLCADDDELKYGELLTKGDLTCHYFCLLLASGLYQNGARGNTGIKGFLLTDIQKEVKRGLRLKCYYCHEKGATVGCCHKKCKKAFHLPCGRSNGTLHQFYDGFGSYCDEHRPKQYLGEGDGFIGDCNICLSPLDDSFSVGDALQAPCCNNAWFHRLCLQQYAVSAGKHHFRCPMCNCRKRFFDEMQTFGIYIPDQDASWERQNGAFDELLHRHSSCDADTCICPLGRNHDAESGKFDLLLCSSCGSVGSHRTCRGLKWQDSALVCSFCASALKKFLAEEKKTKNKRAAATSDSISSGHRSSTPQDGVRYETQEKVIRLQLVDNDQDVDVESCGDNQVPPFFASRLDKQSMEQARSIPSCTVLLKRIDTVLSLSSKGIYYIVKKSGNKKNHIQNSGALKPKKILSNSKRGMKPFVSKYAGMAGKKLLLQARVVGRKNGLQPILMFGHRNKLLKKKTLFRRKQSSKFTNEVPVVKKKFVQTTLNFCKMLQPKNSVTPLNHVGTAKDPLGSLNL